jgi:hypothetical protein
MGLRLERYKKNQNSHLQQSGNDYYEYLKKMKKDQAEDASEYLSSFMTF